MTKRIALGALLALLALAPAVSAKVLIVEDKSYGVPNNNDEVNAPAETNGARVLRNVVASILRTYKLRDGLDYDIAGNPSYGLNVTNLRDGNWVQYAGTSAATLKHYDAVIFVGINGMALANSQNIGLRADSLRRNQNTTRFNSVPMMFVVYGSQQQGAKTDSTIWGGDVTHMGTMGQVMYSAKDPSIRFRTATAKVGGVVYSAASAPGTDRIIIGASSGRSEGTQQDIEAVGFDPFPCQWCDSVWTSTPGVGDSAVVWMRYFDHIPGAKPIVYTQTNDYAAFSLNIPAVWAGMAMLDSLSGGGVFGGAEPPSFGIMVPGVASRGLATGLPWSTGGIPPDDTTNTYRAAGDSLATLGVPVALGVPANLDSLNAYSRDLQYMLSKSANFSLFPFSRYGIDTTDAALGAGRGPSTCNNPADIFGAWRNRTAIGDFTMVGKDSSLASHVKLAFARLDSLYRGRLDRALYAPVDDWSPKNIAGIGADSMYSAFAAANVRAVVTNFRIRNAQVGKLSTRQQGERWTAGRARAPYSGNGAQYVNVLGTAPVDSGAARFDNGSGQTGADAGFPTFSQIERFWQGFIGVEPNRVYGSANFSAGSDSTYTRHSVLVVPFASFGSGKRADRTTLPTRPGWWYTKAIVNAAKVINSCGLPGRTYVAIRKVEDVQP